MNKDPLNASAVLVLTTTEKKIVHITGNQSKIFNPALFDFLHQLIFDSSQQTCHSHFNIRRNELTSLLFNSGFDKQIDIPHNFKTIQIIIDLFTQYIQNISAIVNQYQKFIDPGFRNSIINQDKHKVDELVEIYIGTSLISSMLHICIAMLYEEQKDDSRLKPQNKFFGEYRRAVNSHGHYDYAFSKIITLFPKNIIVIHNTKKCYFAISLLNLILNRSLTKIPYLTELRNQLPAVKPEFEISYLCRNYPGYISSINTIINFNHNFLLAENAAIKSIFYLKHKLTLLKTISTSLHISEYYQTIEHCIKQFGQHQVVIKTAYPDHADNFLNDLIIILAQCFARLKVDIQYAKTPSTHHFLDDNIAANYTLNNLLRFSSEIESSLRKAQHLEKLSKLMILLINNDNSTQIMALSQATLSELLKFITAYRSLFFIIDFRIQKNISTTMLCYLNQLVSSNYPKNNDISILSVTQKSIIYDLWHEIMQFQQSVSITINSTDELYEFWTYRYLNEGGNDHKNQSFSKIEKDYTMLYDKCITLLNTARNNQDQQSKSILYLFISLLIMIFAKKLLPLFYIHDLKIKSTQIDNQKKYEFATHEFLLPEGYNEYIRLMINSIEYFNYACYLKEHQFDLLTSILSDFKSYFSLSMSRHLSDLINNVHNTIDRTLYLLCNIKNNANKLSDHDLLHLKQCSAMVCAYYIYLCEIALDLKKRLKHTKIIDYSSLNSLTDVALQFLHSTHTKMESLTSPTDKHHERQEEINSILSYQKQLFFTPPVINPEERPSAITTVINKPQIP